MDVIITIACLAVILACVFSGLWYVLIMLAYLMFFNIDVGFTCDLRSIIPNKTKRICVIVTLGPIFWIVFLYSYIDSYVYTMYNDCVVFLHRWITH